MPTRRKFLALLGAGGVVVAGGGAVVALLPESGDDGNGPPNIKFGEDPCARCGMLIGDPRFAAGWRDKSGKDARFDDIGCMVTLSKLRPPEDAKYWVHDYHTQAWIDAATAHYVTDPGIRTPMAYGIAAAASLDDAKSVAAAGQTADWATLVDTVKARG